MDNSDRKIWQRPEVRVLDASATASGPILSDTETFTQIVDGEGNVLDTEPRSGPDPNPS